MNQASGLLVRSFAPVAAALVAVATTADTNNHGDRITLPLPSSLSSSFIAPSWNDGIINHQPSGHWCPSTKIFNAMKLSSQDFLAEGIILGERQPMRREATSILRAVELDGMCVSIGADAMGCLESKTE